MSYMFSASYDASFKIVDVKFVEFNACNFIFKIHAIFYKNGVLQSDAKFNVSFGFKEFYMYCNTIFSTPYETLCHAIEERNEFILDKILDNATVKSRAYLTGFEGEMK